MTRPRFVERVKFRAADYAALTYLVGMIALLHVAEQVARVLDRMSGRRVCIHGWYVNTKPPHRGACPVCERVVPPVRPGVR